VHGWCFEVGDAAPVDLWAVDRVAYSCYFFEVNGLREVCGGDDVDDSEVHLLPLLGDRVLYLVFLRVGERGFVAGFAGEGFDVEVVVPPLFSGGLGWAAASHAVHEYRVILLRFSYCFFL